MSPAEAGAILLEEPDWRELWDVSTNEDCFIREAAFEQILRDYRRWHCTGEAPDRLPMPVTSALVALARLGIMPPRHMDALQRAEPANLDHPVVVSILARYKGSRIVDTGRATLEQHDEHCWLVNERAWRIVAIEARTMFLDSFGDQKQIDMNAVNWDKYVEARVAILS